MRRFIDMLVIEKRSPALYPWPGFHYFLYYNVTESQAEKFAPHNARSISRGIYILFLSPGGCAS